MATLKIEERFVVRAPGELVWRFLLDPRRVAPCLPGAALDRVEGGDTFFGGIKVKVGPVLTQFKGKARLAEVDEAARAVTIVGEGKDQSGSGTAKMTMHSKVRQLDGGATEILVNADVEMAGKLVSFGRGLMQGISAQLFKQFSERARTLLEAEADSTSTAPTADTAALSPATPTQPTDPPTPAVAPPPLTPPRVLSADAPPLRPPPLLADAPPAPSPSPNAKLVSTPAPAPKLAAPLPSPAPKLAAPLPSPAPKLAAPLPSPAPKLAAPLPSPAPKLGAAALPSPYPGASPSPGGSVRPPAAATPSGPPTSRPDSLLPPVEGMGVDVEATGQVPAARPPADEPDAVDSTPAAVSVNLAVAGREPAKAAAPRPEPAALALQEQESEPLNALALLWQVLRSWLAGLFRKLFGK
ncbi:MAG TPA: SRPBCC domain-containing protein [Polyangiaceae bacterium]|nr:SRPBCC domain-containing protein [Polyangiaceae bacterium]